MTNYSRGADFERKVQAGLAAAGYFAVRAAGSRGPVDVLAVRKGVVLLVQCKLKLGRMSPEAWAELIALAAVAGAVPVVATRPARGKISYLMPQGRTGTWRELRIEPAAGGGGA